MPDHVHGIVEICHGVSSDSSCVTTRRDEALPRLYNGQHEQMSKISPKRGSLSVIIGSFKSIVSKTVNRNISNIGFHWQPRFYDHIIRDEKSLNKIREYIRMNPKMWEIDKNKVENIFM